MYVHVHVAEQANESQRLKLNVFLSWLDWLASKLRDLLVSSTAMLGCQHPAATIALHPLSSLFEKGSLEIAWADL